MKPGDSSNRPASGIIHTQAYTEVAKWLRDYKNNTMEFKNPNSFQGENPKLEDIERGAFIKSLETLLDEYDKLLKYARLTVVCSQRQDFQDYVRAIRSYLVEELKIEP